MITPTHPDLIAIAAHPLPRTAERLRQLALQRKPLWEFEKAHDEKPDYLPCLVPKKGTPILETIAPYRHGLFIRQLSGKRFDLIEVQWNCLTKPTISSLYTVQLQQEQLSLF